MSRWDELLKKLSDNNRWMVVWSCVNGFGYTIGLYDTLKGESVRICRRTYDEVEKRVNEILERGSIT